MNAPQRDDNKPSYGYLHQHIEALIFCSPEPLVPEEIRAYLCEIFNTDLSTQDILSAVKDLTQKYKSGNYVFEIIKSNNGYQFMTKPTYQISIKALLKNKSKKKLSRSAIETLSIIAYQQPVVKSYIEQIRGVNCDYAIKRLLERSLIEIKGKSDLPGNALLYGISAQFLEYFGIDSLTDLPRLKDFAAEENTIGKTDREQ